MTEHHPEKGNSKLTEDDILIIYKKLETGQEIKEIADQFRIHPATVGKIRNGKTWEHLYHNYSGLVFTRSNAPSRLTESDVIDIYNRLKKKESVKSIAAHYNMSYSCIRRIKEGDIWQELYFEHMLDS